MRPVLALALPLLLALAVACGGGGDSKGGDDGDGQPTLVIVGDDARAELKVELAVTAEQRSSGLMFREEMPEERGMLFVFAQETKTGFWMKNTKIPLSIAFIAGDGMILETQDMEPLSEDLHTTAQAYRYALEVNRGWFERHGLGAGDRVEIPAEAKGE